MEESRLKIVRKKKGLTQKAAAAILGIAPQAWNSAELGKSKMHRNNLEIVTREFDVSFSWFSIFRSENFGGCSNGSASE